MTTADRTGNLVCVDPQCTAAGRATDRAVCASCGRSTQAAGETIRSTSAARPPQPTGPSRVGKGMEIGSRVFYGGFWALVAVVSTVAALASFGDSPGAAMMGLVIAVLAGLYARYIFRGGRWRIMFW